MCFSSVSFKIIIQNLNGKSYSFWHRFSKKKNRTKQNKACFCCGFYHVSTNNVWISLGLWHPYLINSSLIDAYQFLSQINRCTDQPNQLQLIPIPNRSDAKMHKSPRWSQIDVCVCVFISNEIRHRKLCTQFTTNKYFQQIHHTNAVKQRMKTETEKR